MEEVGGTGTTTRWILPEEKRYGAMDALVITDLDLVLPLQVLLAVALTRCHKHHLFLWIWN